MPELTLEDKETLERKKESGNWTGQRIRKSLGPQKHGRYNGSGTGRGRSSRTAYQLRKELYYPLKAILDSVPDSFIQLLDYVDSLLL